MAKNEKQKGKIEEIQQDKEMKQKPSNSAVVGWDNDDDDDDDEANEDLSLKIVEKALLIRAAKLDQNDGNGVILDLPSPSFVGGSGSGVVELESSSSFLEGQAVGAGPSGIKRKKKKKKAQIGGQLVFIATGEEKKKTVEEAETVTKALAMDLVESVDDPNTVDTSDNIVLRKLLRGPRYFDHPDGSGWSTCFNCGEEGHMAVNCPSLTKKKKPCFFCGSLDHSAKQCRKEQDCFICKKGGHRAKDCPERCKGGGQSSKICLRCGNPGHDMFSCTYNYSHDDLKEIQCYICKNFGHLCCANYVNDSPREASCYRCGEMGHSGLACSRLHEEGTSTVSPSLCYKCGEGGHFARECSNSTWLSGECTITVSPSLCYKCGQGGHFARECASFSKALKRNHESSTTALRAHGENKNRQKINSASHDLGKARKRRKTKSEEIGTPVLRKSKHRGGWTVKISEDLSGSMPQKLGTSTPRKSKRRGGWIRENPGNSSRSIPKQNNGWFPLTPSYKGSGGRVSTPQSFNMQKVHSVPSVLHGPELTLQHRFSASRFGPFGNSFSAFGNSSSAGIRRNYDW